MSGQVTGHRTDHQAGLTLNLPERPKKKVENSATRRTNQTAGAKASATAPLRLEFKGPQPREFGCGSTCISVWNPGSLNRRQVAIQYMPYRTTRAKTELSIYYVPSVTRGEMREKGKGV
jgi:hypothetical protein